MSYSDEQLKTACNLIKEGTLTYGQACEKFNIPKSTLHKKCKEAIISIKKRGPATILTEDEEKILVKQCIMLQNMGFPISDDFLQDEVQNIIETDKGERKSS